MKFFINNPNNYLLISPIEANFQRITKLVTKLLEIKSPYFFEVHFVSKYMIKKINYRYRNQNKVTDVISFSHLNQEFHNNLLGEIFICYDQCVTQARRYGKTLVREICFIFLHGLLHLLNFDHQTIKDEKVMFGWQDHILGKLKI